MCSELATENYMHHPPEFDFVQHALGLLVGHTYQGLLVNGNELISRPQTSILHNKETELLVMPEMKNHIGSEFSTMAQSVTNNYIHTHRTEHTTLGTMRFVCVLVP